METLKLQVSAMAHGGEGLARHEGKVVFVPYVLPGEEVLVELTEERANYSRARAVEIAAPSPDRVEPRCRHFGVCGGCQWQHIAYERQCTLREEVVQSQMRRIGHLEDVSVEPTLVASNPWNYRNHVQLHLDEDGQPGYIASVGRSVVPIAECHIMHPLLWDTFEALEIDFPDLERLSLRAGIASGDRLLILEPAGQEPPGVEIDLPVSCVLLLEDGTPVTYVGDSYITETVAGRSLRVSAASFFQVNTAQTEKLLAVAERYANPQVDDVLLDLYCGVGTFGLYLSDRVAQVIGIDSSEHAIEDARFNAKGMANLRYIQGTADQVLPSIEETIDLVILDPPRHGVGKDALTALVSLAPSRVVYVSCDPATLARDCGRMTQAGYEVSKVQIVDMFPQTYHVEAVALLQGNSR